VGFLDTSSPRHPVRKHRQPFPLPMATSCASATGPSKRWWKPGTCNSS